MFLECQRVGATRKISFTGFSSPGRSISRVKIWSRAPASRVRPSRSGKCAFGGVTRGNCGAVRPLSGARALSAEADFDLYYRPASDVPEEEEVKIDAGKWRRRLTKTA